MGFGPRSYKAASLAAGVLPAPLVHGAARAISASTQLLSADRRLIVERNVRRVGGDDLSSRSARRAVQRTFDSYARYFVDCFRLPRMSVEQIDAGFTHAGVRNIEAAVASGTGPILALPHLGGWEWAAAWLSRVRGYKVTAVVEPLDPPELYEWFVDFRSSLGVNVIPLGPDAFGELASAVGRGDVVCLLADRDIGGSGVEVEFFGERTTLPAGPATLALRTGAVLLPTAVYFDSGRCHGQVEAPVEVTRQGRLRDDVERITQSLATELERLIRRAPEQWHLMQPNWPSDQAALDRGRR